MPKFLKSDLTYSLVCGFLIGALALHFIGIPPQSANAAKPVAEHSSWIAQ